MSLFYARLPYRTFLSKIFHCLVATDLIARVQKIVPVSEDVAGELTVATWFGIGRWKLTKGWHCRAGIHPVTKRYLYLAPLITRKVQRISLLLQLISAACTRTNHDLILLSATRLAHNDRGTKEPISVKVDPTNHIVRIDVGPSADKL